MGVPLLDSLNYNIFDVTTLPLHNSLQAPPEVPGNQWENPRSSQSESKMSVILFRRAEIVVGLFAWVLVLYKTPEEIVQRTEIRLYSGQLQSPFFWAETEVSFNQIQGQISRVCLSPILLKPKFQKFFHRRELGEGLFFQYLSTNWTINIFLNKNRTNKPLCAEHRPYSDSLWMQDLRKNTRDLNSPICDSYVIITLSLGHLWCGTLNCFPYKRRTSFKFFCVL